jgi:hypothetical protein
MEPPGPTPDAPDAPAVVPPPAPEQGFTPAPPPGGLQPPAARRRSRTPLIAIILVVLVVILAGGGYLVGGFVYAQGRLNTAADAYNKVVDHQSKLGDFFNSLSKQFAATDPASATADSIKKEKALYQQLVSQSQAAQPQVTSDDASLASADAGLKENQWLTALSRSSMDTSSAKIGHFRAALAVAQTILADYIQYGMFFETVDDAATDLDTLSHAAEASDFTAAAAAVQTLKNDVAKAIPLDHAPGLPPEVDSFVRDLQKMANDFASLLNAASAGDSAGVQAAASALDADSTKLDGYDFAAIDTKSQNFYQALIDQYNAEVDKANKA